MQYGHWPIGIIMLGLAAGPAAAAPRFYDDCVAPESTVFLRIESCTFSLKVEALDDEQRVQVLLNRAKGYAAQVWPALASADLEEAKRLAPEDPEVSAALADVSHFIGGRQDVAIAGYKDVLQQKGDDPAALLKLGTSYLMSEKFDLARESFTKVLAIDPDNVQALAMRSSTYAHDKRYDLALADLDRAVALAPDNVGARQWRAEELLYAGDFARAIADMNVSLKARPNSPFYRMRGLAEYMTGDYVAAEEDFHHDLNFGPVAAHLAAWRFFAETRAGGESAATAQSGLRDVIDLLRGNWPTSLLKYLLDEATIEDVEKAVASTPHETLRQVRFSQAHSVIGEWLTLKGDRKSALAHFKISADLGMVVAMDEVKERREVIPPDTMIEFSLARARLKESAP